MITSEEIIRMLDSGAEIRNYDFKKGFKFQDKTKETLGLIEDIMACANTQDGGTLIIGFDNITKQFAGEDNEWWVSFDTTVVVDLVNKYCEPRINIEPFVEVNFTHGENTGPLVILQISEFEDVPIICKRHGHTSDGEHILKESSIYIRTNRASTERISNVEDMRNLINRAVLKRGDSLLEAFTAIMQGQRAQQPTDPLSAYQEEVNDARREIG